jgi:hypothetical protein
MFVVAAGRQAALIAGMGALIRVKVDHTSEVYGDAQASSIIAGPGISIWWPIGIWSIGDVIGYRGAFS